MAALPRRYRCHRGGGGAAAADFFQKLSRCGSGAVAIFIILSRRGSGAVAIFIIPSRQRRGGGSFSKKQILKTDEFTHNLGFNVCCTVILEESDRLAAAALV